MKPFFPEFEEINSLIVNRFTLHPALGKGHESEKLHFRKSFIEVFEYLKTCSSTSLFLTKSKAITCLTREFLVCKLQWPVLDIVSNPEWVNQRILIMVKFPFSILD